MSSTQIECDRCGQRPKMHDYRRIGGECICRDCGEWDE